MQNPKHGEVWVKLPCSKGPCQMGISLGVGVHRIDRVNTNWAWDGACAQECGCYYRVDPNTPTGVEEDIKLIKNYKWGVT